MKTKINKKIIFSFTFLTLFFLSGDLALASKGAEKENSNKWHEAISTEKELEEKICEPFDMSDLKSGEVSYLKTLINQKDINIQKKETEEKRAAQDIRITSVFTKIEKYIDEEDLDKAKNYKSSIVKNTKDLRLKTDEASLILNINKKDLEKIVEKQNDNIEALSKEGFKNCDEQESALEKIRLEEKNDLKDLVRNKKEIYNKEIQILQKKFSSVSSEILSRMKADLIK
jgi:hypothetical protein